MWIYSIFINAFLILFAFAEGCEKNNLSLHCIKSVCIHFFFLNIKSFSLYSKLHIFKTISKIQRKQNKTNTNKDFSLEQVLTCKHVVPSDDILIMVVIKEGWHVVSPKHKHARTITLSNNVLVSHNYEALMKNFFCVLQYTIIFCFWPATFFTAHPVF